MDFGLLEILKLIGSLGFFIYGMKIMSEGIQEIAGDRLRSILSAITNNRFAGVLTGFFTTSLIQSSSATTVMVVSFVNAGLLTLRQAIGVIMGANIGTTITGILIATFALSKFSLSAYALPIIAIGFPLLMAGKGKTKNWGEFLIGFALLFMGLGLLKDSVPELSPDQLAGLQDLTQYGFLSVILFVFIGTLITVVLQSSSAAMALTLVMCDMGYIPFDIAAAIVLGENIGTTITANLAAIIGNAFAKRAARAHFIFNVFGVIWMLIVFNWYIGAIDSYMVNSAGLVSPFVEATNVKWGLTLFHSSFNIINTFILIWFVGYIEKIVNRMVSSKSEEDDELRLKFIQRGVFSPSEISIAAAREEVKSFGKVVTKMFKLTTDLFETPKLEKKQKLLEKIEKHETHTDELEEHIGEYLIQATEGKLSPDASHEIRNTFEILTNLERAADIILLLAKGGIRLDKKNIELDNEQKASLSEIQSLINQSLEVMSKNLGSSVDEVNLPEAIVIEEKINNFKNQVRKDLNKKLGTPGYDVSRAVVYRDLIYGFESLGDHIVNVSESLLGEKLDLD